MTRNGYEIPIEKHSLSVLKRQDVPKYLYFFGYDAVGRKTQRAARRHKAVLTNPTEQHINPSPTKRTLHINLYLDVLDTIYDFKHLKMVILLHKMAFFNILRQKKNERDNLTA